MNFHTLTNKKTEATFKNAVIKGITSDKGLFFSEEIKPSFKEFWNTIEITFKLIYQFVNHFSPLQMIKLKSD